MKYRFTRAAELDLANAANFYETQSVGLGAKFGVDVGLGLARVLDAPNRWPEMDPGFRRYRLDRFPYALIYRLITRGMVEVLAVHDLRSRPDSWRENA